MKKNEFIQILELHQPEETKISGFLLFKGQDSEALRQLKSILRHPQVFNLSNEAELPNEVIEAVKKVILEAMIVDPKTKWILDSLSQRLLMVANTSSQVSSSSNEVVISSTAISTKTIPAYDPSQNDFWYAHTLLAQLIFNALPTEAEEEQEREDQPKKKWNSYSRRAFFRVFATTNKEGFEPVRQGVLNGMLEQFLKCVADAEMKSAEAILKLAMDNKPMLRKLLTTQKTIIQFNYLPVTGTALEIALKCWDWSSCKGGQEEMAEMIMRYMRLLPEGEALIESTDNKLFPEGKESHQKAQEARATEFATSILEPLATTLKDASDEDIQLAYALTEKDGSEFDEYINTTLVANKLWQALMVHHEAIKNFMSKDTVYNPFYMKKALEIVDRKYENEQWDNLSKREDRLCLLAIHGVGSVQACGPRLVGMLFARYAMWDFFNANKVSQKEFKVDRSTKFNYGNGDAFERSKEGVLLVSNKFFGELGPLGWVRLWRGLAEAFLSSKNTTLTDLCPNAQSNQPRLGV